MADLATQRPLRLARLCILLMLLPGTALAQQDVVEDISSDTGYVGAMMLQGDNEVRVGGQSTGIYGNDGREQDRYLFWEGDSLFAGVIDEETANRVDLVAEFYWFESSIPRNSDFYVVVLKVTTTPQPGTNWGIATDESWVDDIMFRDIGPVQHVDVAVDRSGTNGALRWDWSVPFQSYRWEPERVIEVQQQYTAGANVEGGAMKSVTEGVNIQAKGSASAEFQVSTRYTITLWRWEMRVSAGATDMEWQLTALDPEHARDPAYHEYFLVVQAERGRPVTLDKIDIAGTLRHNRRFLPDSFMDLSFDIQNIVLTPPTLPADLCPEGSRPVDGECVADCPVGYRWTPNGCVELCPSGQHWENGSCKCGPGTRPHGNTCIPECPRGFTARGQDCIPICDPGFVPQGNRCVPNCPQGSHPEGATCVLDEQDTVVCGRGTHDENGVCVADEQAEIPTPEVESPRSDTCAMHVDCPYGSHCRAGVCASECLYPEDCRAGLTCNARSMCVPSEPAAAAVTDSGGCNVVTGGIGQTAAGLWSLLTRR